MTRKPLAHSGSSYTIILGGRLGSSWPEATAKQSAQLSRTLSARIVSIEKLSRKLWTRNDCGFSLNLVPEGAQLRWLWPGGVFATGLSAALVSISCESILLSGGVDSVFYRLLPRSKVCPIITSPSNNTFRYLATHESARNQTKCFIAQGSRITEELRKVGIADDRLVELFPLVDERVDNAARDSEPASAPTILSASSPNFYDSAQDNYHEKGVDLLLDSFSILVKSLPARLVLLWRGHFTDRLLSDIDLRGLGGLVEVVNRPVNIHDFYRHADVVVIPYRSLWRSPAIPLSGVEALCSGRPLVLTDVSELSGIVCRHRCGAVSHPAPRELAMAMYDALHSPESYVDGIAEFRRWYIDKQSASLQLLKSRL